MRDFNICVTKILCAEKLFLPKTYLFNLPVQFRGSFLASLAKKFGSLFIRFAVVPL